MVKPLCIDLFCGLIASLVHLECKSRDQQACDRSGKVSRSYEAGSFRFSAMNRYAETRACGLPPRHDSHRKTDRPWGVADIVFGDAKSSGLCMADLNYKSSSYPAFAYETRRAGGGRLCLSSRQSNSDDLSLDSGSRNAPRTPNNSFRHPARLDYFAGAVERLSSHTGKNSTSHRAFFYEIPRYILRKINQTQLIVCHLASR
jgi:hypothetical protein